MGFISDFLARSKIDEAAKDVATQFIKRLPKERISDAKRVSAEFDILLGHARGIHRQGTMGVFGTSRFVNTFQWHLIEAGYDAAFSKRIGNDLAVKLASSK